VSKSAEILRGSFTKKISKKNSKSEQKCRNTEGVVLPKINKKISKNGQKPKNTEGGIKSDTSQRNKKILRTNKPVADE